MTTTAPTSTTNHAALARAVSGRRAFLRLALREISERGGPSHMTVWSIEKARGTTEYRVSTLESLDLALEWPRGTCARIADDIIDGLDMINAPVAGQVAAAMAIPTPTRNRPRRAGGAWYVDPSSQPLGWMIKEQWMADERHDDDRPVALFSDKGTAEMVVNAVNNLL